MKNTLIALATISFLFISCRKLVTAEFPDIEATPVLNAILEEGKTIKLQLSYMGNINGDTLSFAQDAIVILKENNSTIDTLTYEDHGLYASTIIAKEKTNYYCEAQLINGKKISAYCSSPPKCNILSYKHLKEAGKDEEGVIYPAINVTFENTPDEKLYFQVLIKLIHKDDGNFYYNEELKEWEYIKRDSTWTSSPELLNITDPLILNEGLPLPVFSNELIKENSYTITLNYTTGEVFSSNGSTKTEYKPLVIELRSINYEYYQYVKQLYLYEQGRYPEIFGDVARVYPLYSNVYNGYGIFAAYTSCITDTIVVE